MPLVERVGEVGSAVQQAADFGRRPFDRPFLLWDDDPGMLRCYAPRDGPPMPGIVQQDVVPLVVGQKDPTAFRGG